MNFSQSGNLGDLLYSLSVVKKMGHGNFYVKLNNIPNVIRKYDNGPVPPEYVGRLSNDDYNFLKPLLEVQEYIDTVDIFDETKHNIDVDLDDFRGTIHRTVPGNFLRAFYTTHNIPFTEEDLIQQWITVPEVKRVSKWVVARSPRWRRMQHNTNEIWQAIARDNNFETDAVFVGLKQEHEDFINTMNVNIPYYPVSNFLELAQVIAGADGFFGNQTFTYGIAQGLCKTTVLEVFSARPLEVNECYFARPNCYYF